MAQKPSLVLLNPSVLFSAVVILLIAGCMRMPFEPVKNHPPDKPEMMVDLHYVPENGNLQMRVISKDPDDDKIAYQVQFTSLDYPGESPEYTVWSAFFPGNTSTYLDVWGNGGAYSIRIRCKDDQQAISPFSDSLHVYFDSTPPDIVSADSILTANDLTGSYKIRVTGSAPYGTQVRVIPGDGSPVSDWLYLEEDYDGSSSADYQHTFPGVGTYQLRAQTRHYNQTTSSWSEPYTVNVYSTPQIVSEYAVNQNVRDFIFVNDYAYMITSDTGVCPISLQNPLQPVQYDNFSGHSPGKLATDGQNIFVYTNNSNLHDTEFAFSLSNPAIPTYANEVEINAFASGVSGNTLIFHPEIGSWQTYLCKIFTYDSEQGFSQQGAISLTDGRYGSMSCVSGSYAYMLARGNVSDALYTVNISDLQNPQIVDTKVLDGTGYKLSMANGYLILCGTSWLETYNTSTPSHPVRTFRRGQSAYPIDIHFGNGFFCIAYDNASYYDDDPGKVELLTIASDGTLSTAIYYFLNTYLAGVWCGDDYLYISAQNHLYTLQYPGSAKQITPRKSTPDIKFHCGAQAFLSK